MDYMNLFGEEDINSYGSNHLGEDLIDKIYEINDTFYGLLDGPRRIKIGPYELVI